MQKKWRIGLILLVLLMLPGCGQETTTNEDTKLETAKAWFVENEPSYNVRSIEHIGDVYVLLTTFTPPGVEDTYTMVRAYVIGAVGDSYEIRALEDTYGPGSAGFSVELMGTDDVTVIFGDIGSGTYDFKTDIIKKVTFTEAIVQLSDGTKVSIPIQNNTPYIGILSTGAEVLDVTYKTEDGALQYSDYYSGELDPTPDNSRQSISIEEN